MRAPALLIAAVVAMGCGQPAATPARPPHASRTSRVDELRPTDTASGEMWKFDATDVVEQFDTDGGAFRVHFTRAGKNAVPLADPTDSGVPDLVRAVDSVYEAVATKYQTELGFRAPLSDSAIADNGGDGRFDIYLLDFGMQSDGAFRADKCFTSPSETCIGYVAQENDFKGYGYPSPTVATRILGSHEYFHGIQDAYDGNQDVVITEGTAVWGTEQFDPSTDDFEGFIGSYLDRMDRSLDSPPPGPVPSFAYGSAIFFQFLTEKYGPNTVRELWERLENGHGAASEPDDVADPHWIIQLDALLREKHSSSFAEAFRTFTTWTLYDGTAADPTRGFKNGRAYPLPAMVTTTLPHLQFPLRVYYASAQFLVADVTGRTRVNAALVDDPSTPDDETRGLALVLATRQAGKNHAVLTLSDVKSGTEGLDVNGLDDVVVAIINTDRSGTGAVLSKRPGLCIGSPTEVATCRGNIDPALVPDAGSPEPVGSADAGPVTPAPTPPPPCGCGTTGATPVLALALFLFAWFRSTLRTP